MLDGGSRGDADRNAQFVGHDHGQRGFAKPGRTGKQYVVRGHIAFTGRVEEQLQLRLEPGLADESVKDMRTQFLVADRFVADRRSGNHAERFLVRAGIRLFECASVLHIGFTHLPLSRDANASFSTRGTSSAANGVSI